MDFSKKSKFGLSNWREQATKLAASATQTLGQVGNRLQGPSGAAQSQYQVSSSQHPPVQQQYSSYTSTPQVYAPSYVNPPYQSPGQQQWQQVSQPQYAYSSPPPGQQVPQQFTQQPPYPAVNGQQVQYQQQLYQGEQWQQIAPVSSPSPGSQYGQYQSQPVTNTGNQPQISDSQSPDAFSQSSGIVYGQLSASTVNNTGYQPPISHVQQQWQPPTPFSPLSSVPPQGPYGQQQHLHTTNSGHQTPESHTPQPDLSSSSSGATSAQHQSQNVTDINHQPQASQVQHQWQPPIPGSPSIGGAQQVLYGQQQNSYMNSAMNQPLVTGSQTTPVAPSQRPQQEAYVGTNHQPPTTRPQAPTASPLISRVSYGQQQDPYPENINQQLPEHRTQQQRQQAPASSLSSGPLTELQHGLSAMNINHQTQNSQPSPGSPPIMGSSQTSLGLQHQAGGNQTLQPQVPYTQQQLQQLSTSPETPGAQTWSQNYSPSTVVYHLQTPLAQAQHHEPLGASYSIIGDPQILNHQQNDPVMLNNVNPEQHVSQMQQQWQQPTPLSPESSGIQNLQQTHHSPNSGYPMYTPPVQGPTPQHHLIPRRRVGSTPSTPSTPNPVGQQGILGIPNDSSMNPQVYETQQQWKQPPVPHNPNSAHSDQYPSMPIVNVNTPLQTVASPPSFIAELPAHPPSPPPATNRLPEATQKLSSANAQQSTKPAPQKFPVPGPHADAEAPRDVLRYCPEGDFTDFEGIWYTHLECLGFFVCSKCYNDYIYRSPYGNLFKGRTMASGTVTRCYFKTPRMLQLWSKTTESKSDTELKTFMESRPKIPECPKLVASERTWYTTTEGLDYRFTACQACYEDRIAPTNFKPYFKPGHPDPSKPTPLACEFGVKLVDRALKECAKQNSWPAFARSLNDRACLPKCTGSQHVDPNSRKWFGPVQHIDNIAICETCYSDNIIFTEFTSQFTQLRTDTLPQGTTWACVFWQPPICVAWSEVIEQKNFNIFLESARVLANSQCSHEATERDKWYTLAEGCENFDICLACYTGVIKPLGFAHFFKDVTYAPGSARMCDLNPKMQRFQLYMEKLQIAVTTNNFSPLSITLRKYANLPPCPRSEHVSGRAFYGDSKDYFTACLSCYEEVMTGTRFADKVQYKPSVDNGVCHMYGKLRAHWRTACANDDWDFFQAAVKHRTDIYLQVIPEMKQILAMGRIRMMTQMSMFSAGLMMQGGDAILSAAGGSGYDYGNSNVGYGFASSGGVQGAEMFNNAMNMRPHNAGDMMRAYQLEAMWKEVE